MDRNGNQLYGVFAQRYMQKVQEMGCTYDQEYERFIYDKEQHFGFSEQDSPWFKSCLEGEMADDHVITAGLSEMTFPENIVLLTSHASVSLTSLSSTGFTDSGKEKRKGTLVDEMSKKLKPIFGSTEHPTLIVPVNYSTHWGVAVAELDISEHGLGNILWADSLFWGPPGGIMSTIADLMKSIYPSSTWRICSENAFSGNVKSLNIGKIDSWERQRDGYSCGFYLLSFISKFAKAIGRMPAKDFKVYRKSTTEKYRESCIRALVSAFGHVRLNESCGKVLDMDVMIFLNSKISKGIVNSSVDEKNSPASNTDGTEFCSDTESAVNSTSICHDYPANEEPALEECGSASGLKVVSGDLKRSSAFVPRTVGFSPKISSAYDFRISDSKFFDNEFEQKASPLDVKCKDQYLCRSSKSCEEESVSFPVLKHLFFERAFYASNESTTESYSGKTEYKNTAPQKSKKNEILIVQKSPEIVSVIIKLQETGENYSPNYSTDYITLKTGYVHSTLLNCMEKASGKCPCAIRACLNSSSLWDVFKINEHSHPPVLRRKRKGRVWFEDYFKRMVRPSKHLLNNPEKTTVQRTALIFPRTLSRNKATSNCHMGYRTLMTTPNPNFPYCELSNERNHTALVRSERHHIPSGLKKAANEVNPQLNTGEQDNTSFIPLITHQKATILSYLESAQNIIPHTELIACIHHIFESFGFPVCRRNAKYSKSSVHGKISVEGTRNRRTKAELARHCLIEVDLVCSKKRSSLVSCPFLLSIHGRTSQELHPPAQEYFIVAQCWEHNHAPQNLLVIKSLPHEAFKGAITLSEKCHIRAAEIVRILEASYNFTVDTKALVNALNYRRSRIYPVQRDAAALLENLRHMRDEDPKIGEDRSLKHVCFALSRWQEDYFMNGIAPGISIDAKALACVYDIPLVTVNGRDNNGKNLTFFMGYVCAENESSFQWFLERFKICYKISPKFVCCDQDMSIINALRKVFPTSLILLDAYHLNVNQLKNCINLQKKTSLTSELINDHKPNQDLYNLRNSPTEEIFLRKRNVFEQKYLLSFSGRGIRVGERIVPKWFFILYYQLKEMLVACYSRKTGGLRFLFQGSGYSESSNASYKRQIMNLRVPLSNVPVELEKISNARHKRQRSARGIVKKSHGALLKTIFIDGMDIFVRTATSFAIDSFLKKSFYRSQDYDVVRYDFCETILDGAAYPAVRFFLSRRVSDAQREHPVDIYRQDVNQEKVLKARCDCIDGSTSGLPCRHITKLLRDFEGGRKFPPNFAMHLDIPNGTLLSITHNFHCYWMWDTSEWKRIVPYCLSFEKNGHWNLDDDNEVQEPDDVTLEMLRQASSANTLSLYRQCERRASAIGPAGLNAFEKLMEEALQKLGSEITVRNPCDALEIVPEFQESIKNPNQGNPKGRGKRGRHRSSVEKFKAEKKR